jgi:hypothetical protein
MAGLNCLSTNGMGGGHLIFVRSWKTGVIVHWVLHWLCRWGNVEFPLPFGRTMSPAENLIHRMDEKVTSKAWTDHMLLFFTAWTLNLNLRGVGLYTTTQELLQYVQKLLCSIFLFFGLQSLTYNDCTSLQTGASLKLTILNPKGRIWTMVAGGGASVIYADTVHVCLVLRELL